MYIYMYMYIYIYMMYTHICSSKLNFDPFLPGWWDKARLCSAEADGSNEQLRILGVCWSRPYDLVRACV